MHYHRLLWPLIAATCLIGLVNCQDSELDLPDAKARPNSPDIFRAKNYAKLFWDPSNKPNQNAFAALDLGREYDIQNQGFDPQFNHEDARNKGRWMVEHVLELTLPQRYVRELADRVKKRARDGSERVPEFVTRWRDILLKNRDSLREIDEKERQIDLIRILNKWDSDGNLVGLGSLDDKVEVKTINTLKYHAFYNNIGKEITKDADIYEARATYALKYLRTVKERFEDIAFKLVVRFRLGMEDTSDALYFETFARRRINDAIRKLENRVAQAREARRNTIRNRRQVQSDSRFSPSLNNRGNGVYVALGDSFSAGLGAGTLDNRTADAHGAKYPCWRYSESYPHLINNALHPTDFDFLACSSTTSEDLIKEQIPNLDPWSSLISVTTGGNDMKFASIAKACIYPAFAWTVPDCKEIRGNCCRGLLDRARSDLRALSAKLDDTYKKIKERAPDANLLVLGYPKFFNDKTASRNWSPTCWVTTALRRELNDLTGGLNRVIGDAAKRAGAEFQDPDAEFEGHRFCEPGNVKPWFYSFAPPDRRDLSMHPHSVRAALPLEASTVDETTDEDITPVHNSAHLEKRKAPTGLQTFYHPTSRGHEAYFAAAMKGIARFRATPPVNEEDDVDDGNDGPGGVSTPPPNEDDPCKHSDGTGSENSGCDQSLGSTSTVTGLKAKRTTVSSLF